MLPLLVTEDTVTPEGSEALFGPKNHSKLGVGTFYGRGFGVTSTEHCRLKFCSTVLVVVPAGETLTAPMSTVHGKQEVCKLKSQVM